MGFDCTVRESQEGESTAGKFLVDGIHEFEDGFAINLPNGESSGHQDPPEEAHKLSGLIF
jgi:hypothetical protein